MARAIMLQGTGSDVGKTVLVAGLCRAAKKRGLKVRPFKPQNMSTSTVLPTSEPVPCSMIALAISFGPASRFR